MYTSKPPEQADDYLPIVEESCAETLSFDRESFKAGVSWQQPRTRRDSVSVYVQACIVFLMSCAC